VIEVKIEVKRVYEPAEDDDGYRILVDRLWPRGLRKSQAGVDLWMKDIAPSDSLRKWFGHEPEKWEEFKRRYSEELDGKMEFIEEIRSRARNGKVTLLFSSREERNNNAHALKEYIESMDEE